MITAGLLAASVFLCVSLFANLRFGMSLGTALLDKSIYGAASVAADLMKAALPLLVVALWCLRRRLWAGVAAALWFATVGFSLAAAIGFAASTRGEMIATNKTVIESREGWRAKIERTEKLLAELGDYRPASVVQAEIDTLLRTPGADDCTVINGPVTRDICPTVDRLRQELAASQEAAALEGRLAVDREQIAGVPITAAVVDPQSAAMARVTGLAEAEIRDSLTLLMALLIEAGSALGFSIVAFATRRPPAAPSPAPVSDPIAESAPPAPASILHPPATKPDAVSRWYLDRLDIISSGRIKADDAFRDFQAWCLETGVASCTQAMFGRTMTAVHEKMGGQKVKKRDATYYVGVALQERPARAGQRKAMNAR